MVKLGVILVPGKHGILLLGPIPAPMEFTHAATRLSSSAVDIPLAGGDNQISICFLVSYRHQTWTKPGVLCPHMG